MIGKQIPDVVFKTRVRDDSISGDNPFRWQDKTSDDYFLGKKVLIFIKKIILISLFAQLKKN